jgi:hypothetical protein
VRDLRPRSKRSIRVSHHYSHLRIHPTGTNHRDTHDILSQPFQTNPASAHASIIFPINPVADINRALLAPRPPSFTLASTHSRFVVNVRTLLPRRLPRVNSSRSPSASARVFPQLAAARSSSSSMRSSLAPIARVVDQDGVRASVRPSVTPAQRWVTVDTNRRRRVTRACIDEVKS